MLCPFPCSCISKLSYLLHDIFLKGKKTSTYPVCWVRWLRELFLSTIAGVCVKLQEHRRVGFRGHELGSDGQVTEKEIWEGCLRSSDRGRQEPDVFAGLEPWAVEEGVEETWGSGVKLVGNGRKLVPRSDWDFLRAREDWLCALGELLGIIAASEGWEGLSKPEPGHLSCFSSTSVAAKETVIMLSLKWDWSGRACDWRFSELTYPRSLGWITYGVKRWIRTCKSKDFVELHRDRLFPMSSL